ncbi:MAG: hypothetical protein IJW45_07495 [Oscillospiraceae bacterium]|nr:hypothetical protein [Oscillospiraceae bacterium]
MDELLLMIEQADAEEIWRILEKVRCRYTEHFPDWELQILAIQKGPDRDRQIDRVIGILERLKSVDE